MRVFTALPAVAALLLAGCAQTITEPDDYKALADHWGYDWKAVSTDGNVLAYTAYDDDGGKPASLDYWAAAVQREKTARDGYRFLDREEITTDTGLPGVVLSFETGEGAAAATYLVGLFVTQPVLGGIIVPARIHVVEAGGLKTTMENDIEKLKDAMRSLNP